MCIAVILTVSWPFVMWLYTMRTHTLMSIEHSVRWSAWAVVLLLALSGIAISYYYGYRWVRWIGFVMIGVLGALIPMNLFDPTSIRDEYSWIRYPTALFLFIAGVLLLFVSRTYNKGEKWPKSKEWIWVVFASGLWYAGADEVGQVHERIGTFFENLFHLPHYFSDLITMAYGVIAMGVLVVFLVLKKQGKIEVSKEFGAIYLMGMALFMTSTMFDTFDFVAHKILRWFGVWLSHNGSGFLQSLFTFWYDPKLVLNGIEEFFECTAALLFAIGAFLLLKQRAYARSEVSFSVKHRVVIVGVCALLLLLGVPWFIPDLMYSRSPFFDNRPAYALMTNKNGLYHSDGLAYDEKVGLIIGNESTPQKHKQLDGPGVFLWRKDRVGRLPDPLALLVDSDSVSIHNNIVYASDGLRGVVYHFDDVKKRFYPVVGKKDGLIAPEAIGWYNDEMYIVNEKKRAIMHVTKDKKVIIDAPRHTLWVSPEEILYIPQLGRFLVTDDATGTIFLYWPGKPLVVWADRFDGLDETEGIAQRDDRIYVTDNGRGEIIEFTLAGQVVKRHLMRFAYRDVQGIAIGTKGEVFFVTADGYDSRSPMPSSVWKFLSN